MFSIQRSALAVELNQLTLARYKLSYYMIEFHLIVYIINCVSPIIKKEMMKLIVKKRFDYSSSNSIGIFLTSFGREVERHGRHVSHLYVIVTFVFGPLVAI